MKVIGRLRVTFVNNLIIVRQMAFKQSCALSAHEQGGKKEEVPEPVNTTSFR